MCANSGESNIETRAFALNVRQYIYPNQTVIRCTSYIKCFFEKEGYMWVSGFCPHGESKENKCSCPRRRNVLPLK
jgi:hypothetical protein